MRIFVVFLILLAAAGGFLFSQRDAPWMEEWLVKGGLREARLEFPFPRTLTAADGRTTEGEVLGFSEVEIAFRRSADGAQFMIPLANLDQVDRDFFAARKASDREEFEALRDRMNAAGKRAAEDRKLAGRRAVWHRDFETATREAAAVDLPICVVFLRSDLSASDDMERKIVQSSEFRSWADRHAVLCLLQVAAKKTGARGGGLDSGADDEVAVLVKRFKTGGKFPVISVLKSDTSSRGNLSGYAGQEAGRVIERFEEVLNSGRGGRF
ncbi:MAG: hypothetical protein KDM91_13830 [Verrucomicrobiae bacterium]|nr:hypothetical protein [Verrucomicrobiae bacterium]MCP5542234.1 hypothetical protein [Akkermansiaceae bacterium]